LKSSEVLMAFTDTPTSRTLRGIYVNYGQGETYYQFCNCCGADYYHANHVKSNYDRSRIPGIVFALNAPELCDAVKPQIGFVGTLKRETLMLGEDQVDLALWVSA